ncbi:MAG: SDR family oxidoreductase [Clostridia bacterium]|nr:SDR family oxidoreductase [Clostridia bacterium]
MTLDFEGYVYLITGSTSGMGQGMAKELLENGANVIINYSHNEENANETRELFKEYEDHTLFVKADISNEDDVKNLFKKIKEKFGRLDGLVNNAVYDKIFSIEDLSAEEYRKELDVNVVGRWLCIKYAIPLLKESKRPRIINIASRLGTKPIGDSVAYCTSEAATIMLTQCSALELTPKYGIKVNTVSPSMTLTPFAKKSYTEDEIKETASKNPSKRLGEVEDTVNAALFLLSDKADYINGENLNVNGGILLK